MSMKVPNYYKIGLAYSKQIKDLVESLGAMNNFAKEIASIKPLIDPDLFKDISRLKDVFATSELTNALTMYSQVQTDIQKILLQAQPSFDMLSRNIIDTQNAVVKFQEQWLETVNPSFETFRQLESAFLTDFSSVFSLTKIANPSLSYLSQNFLKSYSVPDYSFLGDTFLDDISRVVLEFAERGLLEVDGELASEIDKEFAHYVSTINDNKVTRQGIGQTIHALLTILAIAISLLSLRSNYVTGEDIKNGFELTNQQLQSIVDLGEKIYPHIESISDSSEDERIYLVAKRRCPIRISASRTGEIVTYIYPNQIVEQHKREGNWVYVEYFDYLESVPRTGWVSRSNLVIYSEEGSYYRDKNQVLAVLENEIWSQIPASLLSKTITKDEEEAILGFGEHGV